MHVTSRFCNNFSITHYACKMRFNNTGIQLGPALQRKEDKIEHLSFVVNTTAKQVISCCGEDENVCEMFKMKNARAKRVNYCFSLSNKQICGMRREGERKLGKTMSFFLFLSPRVSHGLNFYLSILSLLSVGYVAHFSALIG